MPLGLKIKTTLRSLKVLYGYLGFFKLVKLVWHLMGLRNFPSWDKAQSPKEGLSQDQIRPALQLYKALLLQMEQKKSMEITEKVVLDGTLLFLGYVFGDFSVEKYRQLDEKGRRELVQSQGEKFFNATMKYGEITDEKVSFEVVDCLFPRLCIQAGLPELAPVFCRGDKVFFETQVGGIDFERPFSLAEGGKSCPFLLKIKKQSEDKEK